MDASATLDPTDETITVEEAAHLLGVDPRTVRRYAASGKLSAVRIHGTKGHDEWRVYSRSVEQMPRTVRQGPRTGVRDTVPSEMYREAREKLDAALVQIGQLTATKEQLQIARRSVSTLEEQARELLLQNAELQAERQAREQREAGLRAERDRLGEELQHERERVSQLEGSLQRPRWFWFTRRREAQG